MLSTSADASSIHQHLESPTQRKTDHRPHSRPERFNFSPRPDLWCRYKGLRLDWVERRRLAEGEEGGERCCGPKSPASGHHPPHQHRHRRRRQRQRRRCRRRPDARSVRAPPRRVVRAASPPGTTAPAPASLRASTSAGNGTRGVGVVVTSGSFVRRHVRIRSVWRRTASPRRQRGKDTRT